MLSSGRHSLDSTGMAVGTTYTVTADVTTPNDKTGEYIQEFVSANFPAPNVTIQYDLLLGPILFLGEHKSLKNMLYLAARVTSLLFILAADRIVEQDREVLR